MPDTPTLADLNDQRQATVNHLAQIDHAIASLKAVEQSHMVDASCPHCDFVVTTDSGIDIHLMDVHPNPLIYPDAQSS